MITLTKVNETWMRIDADLEYIYELDAAFQFEIPNAKFNPKVKAKVWDGIIHLVSVYRQLTYVGLYPQIAQFCKDRGYEVKLNESEYGSPGDTDTLLPESCKGYIDSLKLQSHGEPLTVRPEQYHAVYQCLKYHRHLIQSPTGSGKSLQIYSCVRWLHNTCNTILIIVPTVALVLQMLNDFKDYTSDGWGVDEKCHIIYSGKEKDTRKRIVISTWQSIFKLDASWFSSFSAVIVDEVHLAKAASITGIMEKCTKAKYRLGFTGSLDKSTTHRQMLIALFGETTKVATTRDLIDKGHLSDIKIKALVMKHPKEVGKLMNKVDYKGQVDYIIAHDYRNRFIRNLALSLKGNTLVLFNYVDKHGSVLYDMIKEKATDRDVFFVHGGVEAEDRETIRNLTEKGKDVILVASSGTMSTGTNLKRLHNIIFTSPTKSFIRVIQSIGRGLRKAKDKDKVKLFDIADNMQTSRKKNYVYNHFALRLQYYAEEQFDYDIVEIDIK